MDDNQLAALETLRRRLNNSGIERTVGLGKALGTDCPNYNKSKRLFHERDLPDILRLINDIRR